MPSKIVIIGGSGLLGSHLKDFFSTEGYEIICFSHTDMPKALPDNAIVINLAGAGIANRFWTKSYRKKIIESRIKISKKIVNTLSPKTRLYISASGIGYYGDTGLKIVSESSPQGVGFLSEVCQKWEAANKTPLRHVIVRIAPVLTPEKGYLAPLKMLSSLGFAAILGSGKQWQCWIHHVDLSRAFLHIINTPYLSGPVILASPKPVRQKHFAEILCKILHRWLFLKIPSSILRLLPGRMGEELFLSSCRAEPQKLIDSGFFFLYPSLKKALQSLCN